MQLAEIVEDNLPSKLRHASATQSSSHHFVYLSSVCLGIRQPDPDTASVQFNYYLCKPWIIWCQALCVPLQRVYAVARSIMGIAQHTNTDAIKLGKAAGLPAPSKPPSVATKRVISPNTTVSVSEVVFLGRS